MQDDIGDQGAVSQLIDRRSDEELLALMSNLGGHDMASMIEAFEAIDHDRPVCFIAYTIKGVGLPFQGHKDNHAGLMTVAQMEKWRERAEHPPRPRMGEIRRAVGTAMPIEPARLELLSALARKVLWLSSWTIHHANHIRPNTDGLKVGGHQASSASLANIMSALYFSCCGRRTASR